MSMNSDTQPRTPKFGEPWKSNAKAEMHVMDSDGKGIASFGSSWNNYEEADKLHQENIARRDRAIACVNLLAGHDPASVVVLDKETAEAVRNILDKMYNDYETTPQDFGAAWIDEEDSNRIGKALAKLTASMGGEKV